MLPGCFHEHLFEHDKYSIIPDNACYFSQEDRILKPIHAFLKRVSPAAILKCRNDSIFAKQYILDTQADSETLDLKQSWDGLHFLLSPGRRKPAEDWDTAIVWGGNDVLGIAILGKEVLNRGCRLGTVSPKWIDATEVKDIAAMLNKNSWESLDENYNAEQMLECGVYPDYFWDNEADAHDFLKHWYHQLRKFYDRAAAAGSAIICYQIEV